MKLMVSAVALTSYLVVIADMAIKILSIIALILFIKALKIYISKN